MPDKRRSIFQIIFGDELGEMLQTFLIVPAMMLGFLGLMSLIFFIQRIAVPGKSKETEILEKVPASSKELIGELVSVQIKTQQLITKLSDDTQKAESLLSAKQSALQELQARISLLQLTPEQRKIVEQYNISLGKDPSFKEWIMKRNTRFEILSAVIISGFFYFLGIRRGQRQQRISVKA